MWSSASGWTAVLAIAAVGLAGCPGGPKAGGTQALDAGAAPVAAQAHEDDGVPEGFIDPLTASQQIQDPVKFAKKMDQIAQELDPNDAPEYAKKMVDHLKQVTQRIADNLEDCDQRAKVQAQTMLLMGPIAESLAKTLARFQVKCPEQAQAVAELLQTVVGT